MKAPFARLLVLRQTLPEMFMVEKEFTTLFDRYLDTRSPEALDALEVVTLALLSRHTDREGFIDMENIQCPHHPPPA